MGLNPDFANGLMVGFGIATAACMILFLKIHTATLQHARGVMADARSILGQAMEIAKMDDEEGRT